MLITALVTGLSLCALGPLDDRAAELETKRDANGFLVHRVDSARQSAPTTIRVLSPDALEPGRRYPVVYVLPVEAQGDERYGDGLREVRARNLHNIHRLIFVAPSFARLPWYADHPTDSRIRQEAYLLEDVVPLIDRLHPSQREAGGRWLLGFSKSGWGAFSLALRHPEVFRRAAAWDAPLMMDRPGLYGSGPIFGAPENFEHYRLTRLVAARPDPPAEGPLLIHAGFGNFRAEHERFELLLREHGVPHRYLDGPRREHCWESGWVAPLVAELVRGN